METIKNYNHLKDDIKKTEKKIYFIEGDVELMNNPSIWVLWVGFPFIFVFVFLKSKIPESLNSSEPFILIIIFFSIISVIGFYLSKYCKKAETKQNIYKEKLEKQKIKMNQFLKSINKDDILAIYEKEYENFTQKEKNDFENVIDHLNRYTKKRDELKEKIQNIPVVKENISYNIENN